MISILKKSQKGASPMQILSFCRLHSITTLQKKPPYGTIYNHCCNKKGCISWFYSFLCSSKEDCKSVSMLEKKNWASNFPLVCGMLQLNIISWCLTVLTIGIMPSIYCIEVILHLIDCLRCIQISLRYANGTVDPLVTYSISFGIASVSEASGMQFSR